MERRLKPDRLPLAAGAVCAGVALILLCDLAIPTLGLPGLLLAFLALLFTWAAFGVLLWIGGERLDRPWAFALCVGLGLLARVIGLGRGPSVAERLLGEVVVVCWTLVGIHGLFLAFRRDRGAGLMASASVVSMWGAWLAWARDPSLVPRMIFDGAPVDGLMEAAGLANFVCAIGAASFVVWTVRLLARELLGRDPS